LVIIISLQLRTAMKSSRPDSSLTRRLFMKVMGGILLLINLPFNAWAFIADSFPVRSVENDTFQFDFKTGAVKKSDGNSVPYEFLIDGLVKEPVKLSYKDLTELPRVEQISDFHCVEGWSVQDVKWGGFRFEEILKLIRPEPEAQYAVFHSLGETRSKPGGQAHYIESFPISELLDSKRRIMLALEMNGQPLSHDHDLGYKGSKFITRVEFAKYERPGWWTLANPIYSIKAPVPQRRLRKK